VNAAALLFGNQVLLVILFDSTKEWFVSSFLANLSHSNFLKCTAIKIDFEERKITFAEKKGVSRRKEEGEENTKWPRIGARVVSNTLSPTEPLLQGRSTYMTFNFCG
jgi:hypothetical protein